MVRAWRSTMAPPVAKMSRKRSELAEDPRVVQQGEGGLMQTVDLVLGEDSEGAAPHARLHRQASDLAPHGMGESVIVCIIILRKAPGVKRHVQTAGRSEAVRGGRSGGVRARVPSVGGTKAGGRRKSLACGSGSLGREQGVLYVGGAEVEATLRCASREASRSPARRVALQRPRGGRLPTRDYRAGDGHPLAGCGRRAARETWDASAQRDGASRSWRTPERPQKHGARVGSETPMLSDPQVRLGVRHRRTLTPLGAASRLWAAGVGERQARRFAVLRDEADSL